jgi:hypothetical protein
VARVAMLCAMYWREGYIPEEWGVATVIPIYKKRNIKTENYRVIRLLCAAYKLYEKIISRRMSSMDSILLCVSWEASLLGGSLLGDSFVNTQQYCRCC